MKMAIVAVANQLWVLQTEMLLPQLHAAVASVTVLERALLLLQGYDIIWFGR
jgi:hypothetical protein